jgi:hypothetical protein
MKVFRVFCCECGADVSNQKSPFGGYLCYECGKPISENETKIREIDPNQTQIRPAEKSASARSR